MGINKERKDKNENLFIGARSLTNDQVKLIVPTYEYIISQIKDIREEATKSKNYEGKFSKKQYNNTIGLFGQRGTGKTSTLYTLINELTSGEDKLFNIVLPIIEPDNYGENTKILGAILGLLKKEVENIENEIEKGDVDKKKFSGFFNECRFKKNNELIIAYNELLEYFCYKEDEYRKLLTQNFSDMETYKKKYSYILSPDYEFSKKLEDFINKLIDTKRNLNSDNKEPLLFIAIDDIDLKTTKCKELVESVMQYTCHPNIVCILSGDYEILEESITLSLLENEKISYTELANDKETFNDGRTLVTRKKYLAQEYLKKILPPAFRHNVVKWNSENIPKFSFSHKNDNGEEEYIFLYEKLKNVFGDYSIFYYKISESDYIIPTSSYEIFDKTPRGLINVFYYLSKFDVEKFNDVNDRYRLEFTKSLIDTIVSSSNELARSKRLLYSESLIWGADLNTTKLNFNSFEGIFNNILKTPKENNDLSRDLVNMCDEIINKFYILNSVKELLNNNNIDIEEYNKTKRRIMYLLCSRDKFLPDFNENISEGNCNNFTKQSQHPECSYNEVFREIMINSDFNFSNAVYNYTKIYLRRNNKTEIIERDLYKILCDLLIRDKKKGEELLIEWIRLSDNDEGLSSMKISLEFLDKYSRKNVNEEYILNTIYKNILVEETNLSKKIYYSEKEYNLLQSPEKKVILLESVNEYGRNMDGIYNRYIKRLIYNDLKSVDKRNKDFTDNNVDKDYNTNSPNKRALYSILLNLVSKKDDKVKADKSIELFINKKFEYFSKRIHKKYIDILIKGKIDDIPFIDISRCYNDIDKFIKLGRRENRTTLFRKTVDFIEEELRGISEHSETKHIGLNEYIKIISKLEYLAYKSYTWIGIFEARELLFELEDKSLVCIHHGDEVISILKDEDIRVLYLYKRYCEIYSKDIYEIEQIDGLREEMKELLKSAFNSAKHKLQDNAKEFGIDEEYILDYYEDEEEDYN